MINNSIQSLYNEISSTLEAIYKKRRRAQRSQKIMWASTGIYLIGMMVNMLVPSVNAQLIQLLSPNGATNSYIYTYLPILLLFVLIYASGSSFTQSFGRYKQMEMDSIKKMVNQLFPTYDFSHKNKITARDLIISKIFSWVKKSTPIFTYGQLKGEYKNIDITISDIGITENNAQQTTMNMLLKIPLLNMFVMIYKFVIQNLFTSKSADNVYYTFRGMFCEAKLNKSLKGTTVVLPNNADNKFNKMLSSQFNNQEKVVLEDPRFTDEFIVYSTNQVEARYVLSLSLMEKITELKNKFDKPVFLSFIDKEMYFAVMNQNGLFSFPAGKLESVEIVAELAEDINTAISVVDEFKLSGQNQYAEL